MYYEVLLKFKLKALKCLDNWGNKGVLYQYQLGIWTMAWRELENQLYWEIKEDVSNGRNRGKADELCCDCAKK